ncbi:beta-lactamase family protein [Bdellovibrio bacteriovorus]|uniref:serine hydrolase domain-containing protein n=1 Tax=Bdellovibrio bacteriovorus TaxID=959 RepID=UPI0021D12C25|nr:serine hydrolase domain-containing protein [Bdellovibrio bacteriovorus]UXR65334.1 beta-lactamase family protein [Bdellovibrio bacteriovorus]
MTLRRFLDHAFTVVIFSWVILQFASCEIKVPVTNEVNLPQKIESTWKNLKKQNLISGSILIQKGDKILFQDGPQDKIYAISSMSKAFVGQRYLALQQQGLDLQTPACHWLKNFCTGKMEKITLQMLLNHKSGFGRDLSFWHFLKRSFNSQWSIQDIDSLPLKESHLDNPPGERFQYSNFGYLVLSRLLELIEKKSFANIITATTANAGLQYTAAIQANDILPVSLLLPWGNLQGQLHLKTILFRSAGAGGIKSSAKDMAKWLHSLDMADFQKIFPTPKDHYAHGWVQSQNQTFKSFWHNGASLGAYSLMAVVPSSDLRIVILTDNFKPTKQWADKAEQFEQYFY